MTQSRTLELNEPAVASVVVEALRQGLGEALLGVVLFGSRARGDALETSDWDLLIVAENLPEKALARRLFLKQLLPIPCRGAVSILARTPAEFTAHLPSLYLDIAQDGRILYDPTGFVTKKLTFLRRLIRQLGLSRETTTAGDVWRWQSEPPADWRSAWHG
jgi:predicted nucleotidyltransferase